MQPSRRSRAEPKGARAGALLALLLASLLAKETPAQDEAGGLYSLPRSQDDLAELQRARQELEDGQFEGAVERLHALLLRDGHGVVPADVGIDRWFGVRQAVVRVLRDLTGPARDAYERLVRRQATHLVDRSPSELRTAQLLQLAHDFPVADAGVRAGVRLGDLALERGDGIDAQARYRAVADADPNLPSLPPRRGAARALVTGEGGDDDGLEAQLEALRPPSAPGRWPAFGGGGDGTHAMQAPIGRPSLVLQLSITADGFLDHLYRPTAYPMHAVGDVDGVYVNDGMGLWALNPLDRAPEPEWRAEGPMTPLEFDQVEEAINPDMVLSAALDAETVVAPLMVPNDVIGAAETQSFKGSINIIRKISSRRLFAFERSTGKLRWSHWDVKDGPIAKRFDGQDVCASPLIEGQTVYAPVHDQSGAIAFYLAAYDLETGDMKWRRLLCSSGQEVNMFGNARQEFASSPLALHEGVLYGSTNLGTCFAVDAADGTIRWITGYDTIPLPRTRLRDQQPRPVFFANNPPVVVDGILACTPLDSEYALGIDVESGRIAWRYHHTAGRPESSVRWLLGALDHEFVFSGLGVFAVEARPEAGTGVRAVARIVASPETLGADTTRIDFVPRGAISRDRIWFLGPNELAHSMVPQPARPHVLDRKGNEDARRNDFAFGDLGNLLLADGFAVLCRTGAVSVFADLPRLQEDAETQVRKDPGDPRAHLRLAKIAQAIADDESPQRTARAIEIYERGLAAAQHAGLGDASPVLRSLADGHFDLALRRARQTLTRDRAAGTRLLRECRDAARRPLQWITAQLEVMAALQGQDLVAELETMRTRYGRLEFRFPQVGLVPVDAYCTWAAIPHVAPTDAARRCQEMIERFGDARFGNTSAYETGRTTLTALIAAHGREIYASIEAEATAALAAAGDDRALLADVAHRYPHSAAATAATGRMIDLAVDAGDLATAARVFATAEARGPGTLRRMMLAAEKSGNLALAHAFAAKLAGRFAETPSDYGADDRRPLGAIAAALPAIAARPAPAIATPVATLALLPVPNTGAALHVQELDVVAGFALPSRTPLCVNVDERELRVFDSDPLPQRLGDARIALPLRASELDRLLLCGDTLVVCEHSRIRGVDAHDGHVRWTRDGEDRHQIETLGAAAGLVFFYSATLTGGDGGTLFGLEPSSGTQLAGCEFTTARDSVAPVIGGDDGIWYWEPRPKPTIVRRDALDAQETLRIELSNEALRVLGFEGRDVYRVQNEDVQTKFFFADATRIVIPIEAEHDGASPRCLALDHRGGILWRWTGRPGQQLQMVAPHGDRTVVVAQGVEESQLTILDARGQVVRTTGDLGSRARVLNFNRRHHYRAAAQAPDVVVTTDNATPPRLSCVSLVDKKPYFHRTLNGVNAVLNAPIVGRDHLLVPVRHTAPHQRNRAGIVAIDLVQPLSAQPTPVPEHGELTFPHTMEMWALDQVVVVESPEGLAFLGDGERRQR